MFDQADLEAAYKRFGPGKIDGYVSSDPKAPVSG